MFASFFLFYTVFGLRAVSGMIFLKIFLKIRFLNYFQFVSVCLFPWKPITIIWWLMTFYSFSILFSAANFFSNLLWINNIKRPNKTAETIKVVLIRPLTEKEIRINIVEIINPEFRITLWNSSVWKNENNNNITSAIIRTLKNCSKKTLLMFLKEIVLGSW